MAEIPDWKRAISPERFDQLVRDTEAKMESGEIVGLSSPYTYLAQQLVSDIERDYPDQIYYQGLRTGQAPYFDKFESTRNKSPQQRQMTDIGILAALLVDPEGNPMRAGSFKEGLKKETLPGIAGFTGFATGFAQGAKMVGQKPAPPSIPGLIYNAGLPLGLGFLYATLGQSGIRELQKQFGIRPDLLIPGTEASEEAGKTVASMAPYALAPWMAPKSLNLGTVAFLENRVTNLLSRGPQRPSDLKDPMVARFIRGIEEASGVTRQLARSRTGAIPVAAGEVGVIGATGALVNVQEEVLPGNIPARLAAETVGSLAQGPSQLAARGLQSLVTNRKAIRSYFANILDRFDTEGMSGLLSGTIQPLQERRYRAALEQIRSILEEQGEDPEKVAERLLDVGRALIDPETGKSVVLTSGSKAGSPTLLALEAKLADFGFLGLDRQRVEGAESAERAMRALLINLINSGDRSALETGARILNDNFQEGLDNNLNRAVNRLLEAYERVGTSGRVTGADGETPLGRTELSTALSNLVSEQLRDARDRESNLWGAVPVYEIQIPEGETPSFIQAFLRNVSTTQPFDERLKNSMPLVERFVRAKMGEFMPEADAGDGLSPELRRALNEEPAPTLTSQELIDLRSDALGEARRLSAAGETNQARIAYEIAEAALDDLNRGANEEAAAAYTVAREFSAALNDVFTRAFAGDAVQRQKTGAQRIPPELLKDKLFAGNEDLTVLRLQQIQNVAEFMGDDLALNNINGIYESLIRDARSTVLEPTIGGGQKVNPTSLRTWRAKNKRILEMFPALDADFADLEQANTLLTRQEANNKLISQAVKRGSMFQKLMPGYADSPAYAVAEALAGKNKIKSMDALVDVANSAPEESRDEALSALRGAVLEWAMTRGGATENQFKASEVFTALFDPMPRAEQGSPMTISMMDYMKNRGLIDDEQIGNIRKMLQEMTRYEMGAIRGNLSELAEGAGPIYDLFLRISGAQLGARAAELAGGENKLIAGAAGSQMMRNVFENIPLTLNMDLVRKMMEDPKLLGTMLKKPKSDVEKQNWVKGFVDFLKGYGLNVSRRPLPGLSREASEFFDEQLLDVMDSVAPPPSEEETPRPPLRREEPQISMMAPAPQRPVAQAAPPAPPAPAPAPMNPQSLQRAAQILGPQDEIGMLAAEMLMRQRPA